MSVKDKCSKSKKESKTVGSFVFVVTQNCRMTEFENKT